MKRGYLFFSAVFFILVITSIVSSLANPAAVYCKEMNKQFGGYEYKIHEDKAGGDYGVCSFNGQDYEEWDFYEGKVGKEHSYCAKKGSESACKNKDILNERFKLTATHAKNEISPGIPADTAPFLLGKSILKLSYNQTNYTYWDWRSPPNNTAWSNISHGFFDNSNGWLTPVKDQSTCGSCWSFSVHGAVESKYELNMNSSRLNPDLSEQNSVSCDQTCYSGYSYPSAGCQAGCSGGWLDLALDYIKDTGTTDENCFSYTSADTSCSSRCSSYSSRLWTIGGEDYSSYWTDFTNAELEQWILDYGPAPVGIYVTESIDANGFMNCLPLGSMNHAVVLVGYNDTGNANTSYWILKNSWGTGSGQNGYFKVNFSMHCHIGDEVYLINTTAAPSFKPSITLNSPYNSYYTSPSPVVFNFSVVSRVYANSTCDLLLNNQIRNTTTAVNNTSSLLSFNVPAGSYNWSIMCWENTLGITNISSNFTITARTSSISASLNSPSNNSGTNIAPVFFNCSSTSNYNSSLANLTFYLWNSTDILYNETKNISGITNSTIFNYTFALESNYSWNCLAKNNASDSAFADSNYTFIYDLTKPNITLISPANDYSTASTSLAFSYNITENNSIANCSLIINSAISATNSSITDLSASQSITQTFSAGVYIWSINCTDSGGNTGNSSSRNFTITQSSSPGGGGGGGSTTIKTLIPNATAAASQTASTSSSGGVYEPAKEQIASSSGYSAGLKEGEKIKFSLESSQASGESNLKETHTITIKTISDNSVSIIIQSEPISITLAVGEEKKLNLTSAEYFDIYIKLNSIFDKAANITVKEIHEQMIFEKKSSGSLAGLLAENANKMIIGATVVLVLAAVLFAGFKLWKKSKGKGKVDEVSEKKPKKKKI